MSEDIVSRLRASCETSGKPTGRHMIEGQRALAKVFAQSADEDARNIAEVALCMATCIENEARLFNALRDVSIEAADEIERLRAELATAYDVQRDLIKSDDAVSKAIGVEYLLDPPDGGDVSLAEGVERIKAERDALRAQLDAERETFVDAHGTTWLRPTAEAYYLVCKARDKHQSELAKERERADAHYRALENVTTKNERLTAERDALRAELAAEREKIEAAREAASETARSWKHRCHHITAALGLDYGDPDFEMPDDQSRADRAEAERDTLRAELSAERESVETYKRTYMELHKRCCGAVAERDALREALREAREWIVEGKVDFNDALADRIDAALEKSDGA